MNREFNRAAWAIRVFLLIAALVGVFLTIAKLKEVQPQGNVQPVVPADKPAFPSN